MGPNPARAPGSPYSQAHYDTVIADPVFASLAQFNIIFVDSYTELSRRCLAWAEQQPESLNTYGKKDLRGAYNLLAREQIAWTQQLQHARARTIILVTILEKIVDDRGVPTWQIQLEGQRTRRELPAILDEIITMTWVTFKDGSLGSATAIRNSSRARSQTRALLDALRDRGKPSPSAASKATSTTPTARLIGEPSQGS